MEHFAFADTCGSSMYSWHYPKSACADILRFIFLFQKHGLDEVVRCPLCLFFLFLFSKREKALKAANFIQLKNTVQRELHIPVGLEEITEKEQGNECAYELNWNNQRRVELNC